MHRVPLVEVSQVSRRRYSYDSRFVEADSRAFALQIPPSSRLVVSLVVLNDLFGVEIRRLNAAQL